MDAETIWRTMPLHIHGQSFPHDTATIIGTPDALSRLAGALKAATQALDGRGVEVEMIDASGEHYYVRIAIAAEVDGMGDTPGAMAMLSAQRMEQP